MKSIKAPIIIPYGIAVFFPALENFTASTLTVDIFYTKNNPLYNSLNCDSSTAKLYTFTTIVNPEGTIVLYETTKELKLGFYTITANLNIIKTGVKTSSLTVGILESTPSLNVGFNYSVYPVMEFA